MRPAIVKKSRAARHGKDSKNVIFSTSTEDSARALPSVTNHGQGPNLPPHTEASLRRHLTMAKLLSKIIEKVCWNLFSREASSDVAETCSKITELYRKKWKRLSSQKLAWPAKASNPPAAHSSTHGDATAAAIRRRSGKGDGPAKFCFFRPARRRQTRRRAFTFLRTALPRAKNLESRRSWKCRQEVREARRFRHLSFAYWTYVMSSHGWRYKGCFMRFWSRK